MFLLPIQKLTWIWTSLDYNFIKNVFYSLLLLYVSQTLHLINVCFYQNVIKVFKPLLAFGAHNTPSQISTKASQQPVDDEDDDDGLN